MDLPAALFFWLKKHVFGRKKSGPRERHFEMAFVCPKNDQKCAKRPKMTKVQDIQVFTYFNKNIIICELLDPI